MSKKVQDNVGLRGFYRVHLVEDTPDGPQIVGDSGWHENVITNLGKNYYLAAALGAVGSSSQISYMALGTGGTPATNATSLGGELASRAAVTAATSSTSDRVQFTATFASSNSFVAGTSNISNIGLFRSASAGTLFAGNTYASSSCATNQNVNTTYVITFS